MILRFASPVLAGFLFFIALIWTKAKNLPTLLTKKFFWSMGLPSSYYAEASASESKIYPHFQLRNPPNQLSLKPIETYKNVNIFI